MIERRYVRQKDIVNQESLRNAKVIIAGVGGLGSFSALNLALAGVGTLIMVDPDVVEESNLNRQVLYASSDIGIKKVEVAAEKIERINPDVHVISIARRVEELKDMEFDIVIDGLDSVESRIFAEDYALSRGKPYVFGAVEGYMGMLTFIDRETKRLKHFMHGRVSQNPQVLAGTAAFTASLQALEAIKYLSGRGDLLRNRLLIYDALSTNFVEVKL